MRPKIPREPSLAAYVNTLQQSGRYCFISPEAREACGLSPVAFKQASRRLVLQSRLASPRRGFFVIVPLEYRSVGAPPPSWYVDALMRFHNRPYYVGVLSAAALHGAAHQQPQEFQIVTDAALRPVAAGRTRLHFLHKKKLAATHTLRIKTETGFMLVSTPEATAVDLVRYAHAAGGIGNVATVLSDLCERLDADRLVQAAAAESDMAASQRLGFLLDRAGGAGKTGPLADWVERHRPRAVPLLTGADAEGRPRDSRWRVYVNVTIEVDE